jgi:uncharacterized tellurite resistance protein B-like protein
MEEEAARRISSLIAGVLCSDGEMSKEERAFLKRAMQKLELDPDTALMPIYEDEVASELAELSEEMRWQTLNLVLDAAAVDGKVERAERAIVDVFAEHLGVSDEDITERLGALLSES